MFNKDLKEDATQVSNVDAGKVDTFGDKKSKYKFSCLDYDNWYKQLFELDDIEIEEDMNSFIDDIED